MLSAVLLAAFLHLTARPGLGDYVSAADLGIVTLAGDSISAQDELGITPIPGDSIYIPMDLGMGGLPARSDPYDCPALHLPAAESTLPVLHAVPAGRGRQAQEDAYDFQGWEIGRRLEAIRQLCERASP